MSCRLPLLLAVAFAAAAPCGASAATSFGILPQFAVQAAMAMQPGCATSPAIAATPVIAAVRLDKASAILGGKASALEQIVRRQSGETIALAPAAAPAVSPWPAAAPAPQTRFDCNPAGLQSGTTWQGGHGQSVVAGNDFLASSRLRIRKTAFDSAWSRVERQALPRSVVARLGTTAPRAVGSDMLGMVNAWANGHIRYVDDKELYGKADYWAGARQTLQRGAGDCEDIAIAKMQLLAALGVPRSDMVLTIARDLARNADHALLVVQVDGHKWLLDNATDRILDASISYDYRPILSFGAGGKWLHGYSRL